MKTQKTYNVVQQWLWRNNLGGIQVSDVREYAWCKKFYPIFANMTAGAALVFLLSLASCFVLLQPSEQSLRATIVGTLLYSSLVLLVLFGIGLLLAAMGPSKHSEQGHFAEMYLQDAALYQKIRALNPALDAYSEPLNNLTADELAKEKRLYRNFCLYAMAYYVVALQKLRDERAFAAKLVYNEMFNVGQRMLGLERHEHGEILADLQESIEVTTTETLTEIVRCDGKIAPWLTVFNDPAKS